MTDKQAYANHIVQRRPDPAGKILEHAPKAIFSCSEKEFKELEALGAVREPTEDEIILWKHKHGGEETPEAGTATIEPVVEGFVAEHKGGGRYVVLKGAEVVVGLDAKLDKDAAEAKVAELTEEAAKAAAGNQGLLD